MSGDQTSTITGAFVDSLKASVIGDRVRVESIADLVKQIVSAWDGRRPVSAQPLYEQLERIHGKEVAAAATVDLKVIAERHGVLVELPKHLRALRLQERQELALGYHRKRPVTGDGVPAARVSAADPHDQGVKPPAPEGEAPTPEASLGKASKPRRLLGVPAVVAVVLLLAYLGARPFLFADDDAGTDTWRAVQLPNDPHALACSPSRLAGGVLDCTIPQGEFQRMPKGELGARAERSLRGSAPLGATRVRVRTDDGVVRLVR